MEWTLPGSKITIEKEDAARIDQQFSAMFLGGGMVLSQISEISGLEMYTVQNWVKRGFLSPPERKRYDMNRLCRILTINMLKSALPMEKITRLIGYINGDLVDASDDLISDARLYFLFVKLAAQVSEGVTAEQVGHFVEASLSDYVEPAVGAKKRIEKALQIMLLAWLSSKLQSRAELMLAELT